MDMLPRRVDAASLRLETARLHTKSDLLGSETLRLPSAFVLPEAQSDGQADRAVLPVARSDGQAYSALLPVARSDEQADGDEHSTSTGLQDVRDMAWFKRQKAGILTDRAEQNEMPEGQWVKCPKTGEIVNRRELGDNQFVVPNSGYHFSMDSLGYFKLIFDDGKYELYDEDLEPTDPLEFTDRKSYADRLKTYKRKTTLNDAGRAAMGTVGGHRLSAAAIDFAFIGGSMGSVVGEVISRAIKRAISQQAALLIISQSGGARMMEGALSLMQMAKTSAQLGRLDDAGLPFISLMTNPTTGGVTASFAMLGDFNLAEPEALIGFAGPRVIRETIGQDLPEGFQSAEFLQEHGFIDYIVDRRELRERLVQLLDLIIEE